MGVIKIDAYFCDRCTHVWMPRENSVHRPLVCPRCKSPYWDRPRTRKSKVVAKKDEKSFGGKLR